MKTQAVYDTMYRNGVIPVVSINYSNDVIGVANALLAGGVSIIEIALRTDAALNAIRKLRKSGMEILIGAGTVNSPVQVKEAADAGADFLITPGYDKDSVLLAVENGIPIIPGICTPTELMEAMRCGLEVVKFFPCESAGGPSMLKSLQGPFPNIRFIPTGGINRNNIENYLRMPNVLACGGSWFCSESMICEHRFDEITAMARDTIRQIRERTPERT